MIKTIAVPYFPGSNGDHDAISRIKENGMKALPLYFHIGDENRLADNARILANEVDGAILPGGFPYEDRLGFGVVPSKINQFTTALKTLVNAGKPVMAFCSGNQIAHSMGLGFPDGSSYRVQMLPNICDTNGELATNEYIGFLDRKMHVTLACRPERTAFTRLYQDGEVIQTIMDHGGGRFWADRNTLDHLLANGAIVARYSDDTGNIIDNYPVNPNGSMLNIESITNARGNLKLGMCHNERKLNALTQSRAGLVFASMREFIEDGCPDLSCNAARQDITVKLKDFRYLCQFPDQEKSIDIYIKMLTDDNERTTAQLFLGAGTDLDRRRLIRIEVEPEYMSRDSMQKIVSEIASLDLFAGIMLKKDLPTATGKGLPILTYEVVSRSGGKVTRDFKEHPTIVDGFNETHEQIGMPNPQGYLLRERLWEVPFLRKAIRHVVTGTKWFFPDARSKKNALDNLLN